MSYNIKFDDITSVQVETQKTMNAWGESMSSLNKAMNDFIKNQNLQGQAISSMRTYLVEVHGTLLQTLVNLMNDYSTNLLLYKDGYYQIDGDLHTKLPGKEFTRLHSDLKGSRDKLKPEIELLKTTKSDISDLVSYEGTSHTSTIMNYNFLMNQLKNLDTSITQYESSHSGQDLVAFKELLAATKALIAEHAGKSRNVGTYQSGDFGKLKSVQRFALAYDQAAKQMESRVERVKAAQERDKARFEALAAEDRAKKGWIDLGVGVFTAVIGIVAIVSTMGAATPLVAAGGAVVGFGTSVYGLSNAEEGIHDIQLGNAGDIQTKAKNPIRDTVFMGNDKLYHEVGGAFVTASAIMIPIGQTQSVVQGLTQFAIGEAGAYTTGQAAYHGTKILGGSEEDAQTANFIGNILGGYAASSAANKFSLNKVSTNPREYSYNMIENPGPLPEINETAAKSFASGKYNVKILEEDTVFFRAGNSDSPLGQYYTRDIPESVIKVRIESAVKPQWIDRDTGVLTGTSELTDIYATKFPKGTVYYEGPTGSQGGVYTGGKEQIFINKPWTIDGIHNNTTRLGGIR
ncbi:T7SS effector LXG polymorphic toxin [Streptococcus infantis]|uniref:T7SS effector LXG polymorphic toxin n=1 Tax=Streptococcus infantis TaxID=68892 RepID=UPI0039C027CE